MSDSVAVNTLFAQGDNAASIRAASGDAGQEPKLAFQDMPALAKIREEQKADNKPSGEATGGDCPVQGASDGVDEARPEKGSKRAAGDADAPSAGDGKRQIAAGQDRVEGRQVKDAAAATLASGMAQVVSTVPQGKRDAVGAASAEQGRVMAQVGLGASQKATVPQIVSKKDLMSRPAQAAPVRMAVAEGKVGVDALKADASKKVVTAQDGKSGKVPEKEGASAAVSKASEGAHNATASRLPSVAARDRAPGAERPEGRVGFEKAAGTVGATEVKASAKTQSLFSTAKQPEGNVGRANAESQAAAQMAEKLERNAGGFAHEGRRTVSSQIAGVNPGKEAQVTAVSGQSKEGHLAGLKESHKEQVDVSVSAGSNPATFSQRLSSASPSASTFDATNIRNTSQSVSDQILDSVRASLAGGEKQVLVRLNPPELGSVTVRFQEQGQQIRAVLEVVRNETRQEVERAIPEVLRTLQEAGIQIRRVEVVLADQSGKDLGKEQLQQDAWAQQQTSQQHAGGQRTPSSTGWPPQSRSVQTGLDREDANLQSLSGTGGINMLI
jgi:flagellar hook-length control protein FliK